MARDLGITISVLSSAGPLRLVTRSGARCDVHLIRREYDPSRVLVVQPVDFEVTFDGHRPELLRVAFDRIQDVERPGDPPAVPDQALLAKALEWPNELAPKSSAAARKRAERALAEATGDPSAAVREAIVTGATAGLAAAVARLAPDVRRQLAELAADTGAGPALALLIDGGDVDRDVLLARAAAAGKIHPIDVLLAAGADPDALVADARVPGRRSGHGHARTALHRAVAGGHRPAVRRLLLAGARVTDAAALAWALVGAPDRVTWDLLLAAGLDPDARDHHGDPLLIALGSNHLDAMVDATLAAGANPRATYPDGSTLLLHTIDLAMRSGPSTFFVRKLLAAGADVDAGRLRGRNPLALARVVLHPPGKSSGVNYLVEWLEAAGAVAREDPDAPPITADAPRPPPPWSARIDRAFARAPHYDVAGVRFTPAAVDAPLAAVATPAPKWNGLGADDIAVARAKLEHLVGPPPSRGDNYKTTFEYGFTAAFADVRLALLICDWKARELSLAVEPHPDAAARERVAAAFWELLTVAPLAPFRDRFRCDDNKAAYHSDGKTAFAEFS